MNQKKILLVGIMAAALLGAVSSALLAAGAWAVGTTTVSVVNSPDDTVDGAPWARDTFVRATSVSTIEGGFTVSIWDTGTFKTPAGVLGELDGTGTWTITGGTPKASATYPSGTIDRSGVTLKDSFTGEWWKRFVDGGEVKTFTWEWTYKSTCWKPDFRQTRTESSATGTTGGYPVKVCPDKPTETQSSSPAPNQSSSSTPHSSSPGSHSSSPAGGAGGFTSMPASPDQDGLPLTGPSIGALVAVAMLMVGTGLGLTLLVRRRKVNFAA